MISSNQGLGENNLPGENWEETEKAVNNYKAPQVVATFALSTTFGPPGPVPEPEAPPIKNPIKSHAPSAIIRQILPDGTPARDYYYFQTWLDGQDDRGTILRANGKISFSVISHKGQTKISKGIWLELMNNNTSLWIHKIGRNFRDWPGYGYLNQRYDKSAVFILDPKVFAEATHARLIILEDEFRLG